MDAKIKTPGEVGGLEPKFQSRMLTTRLRGIVEIRRSDLTPGRRFELHRSGRIKAFTLARLQIYLDPVISMIL